MRKLLFVDLRELTYEYVLVFSDRDFQTGWRLGFRLAKVRVFGFACVFGFADDINFVFVDKP
jgi:hypothetical protein